MLKQAVQDMNIELGQSFIIGDRTVDIMTGINCGMKTVLLNTGYAGSDKKYPCIPNYLFNDLIEAVEFITEYSN